MVSVAGLVPGYSSQAEVDKLRYNWGYVIGGFLLDCRPKTSSGFLQKLICFFGVTRKSSGVLQSFDTVTNKTVDAGTVLTELYVAYLMKFGKPKIDRFSLVDTKDKGEVIGVYTEWEDGFGNTLTLISPAIDMSDEGALILQSAAAKEPVGTRNF